MVVQPLILACGKQNGLCIHMDLVSLPKAYMVFWTHTVNSAPASTNSWANWQIISEIKGSAHRSKWARNGNTEIPAAAPTPQAYSSHCTRAYLLCHTCKGQDLNKNFFPEKNKLWNKDWTWIGVESINFKEKAKTKLQLLFLKTALEWVKVTDVQRCYWFSIACRNIQCN